MKLKLIIIIKANQYLKKYSKINYIKKILANSMIALKKIRKGKRMAQINCKNKIKKEKIRKPKGKMN